jgi:hypothetical protein
VKVTEADVDVDPLLVVCSYPGKRFGNSF